MKLPWQRRAAISPPPAEPVARPQPGVEQRSPTLRRALEATFRKERPEVLDLGPMCGDTVVFLADSGARVSVQEFEAPLPTAAPPGEEGTAPPPLRLDHEEGRFDLVLAWEHVDFVAPARIHEFCTELHRVLADDGRLLLFSVGQGAPGGAPPRPCRFRVLGDDRLVREDAPGVDRPRFVHLTRDLERAMLPLATQALHLQRNQLREFLARKVPLRA